jgi:NAD(P)-dependent dehydrogenase (short-subunit alcohol dehydrogenase family)
MTDRTVLITGCSSGIGRATAEAFLDENWTVYATSRDTDDIADLAEQGCETASLDVTVDADIERVLDRIDGDTGRVDCLVNNAGYGQYGPLEDIPVTRLRNQFDVNVYGPHRLTRAVLPMMRAQEEGTIVNVSSVAGRVAIPGSGAYSASKFALEAMSDALRAEVERFGVDVVLVEPGLVDTEFNDRMADELDDLPKSGAYDWLYDTTEEFRTTLDSVPVSADPETVATTIHDIACMSDPDARYPVGTGGTLLLYAQYLPDSVRDSVVRVVRKLT